MSDHQDMGEEVMSDYMFRRYEEYRDKCDAMEEELAALRAKRGVSFEDGMTDFQYKNTIEMIYQILKANFEAGKTPEEILTIIAALKNEPKDGDSQ